MVAGRGSTTASVLSASVRTVPSRVLNARWSDTGQSIGAAIKVSFVEGSMEFYTILITSISYMIVFKTRSETFEMIYFHTSCLITARCSQSSVELFALNNKEKY